MARATVAEVNKLQKDLEHVEHIATHERERAERAVNLIRDVYAEFDLTAGDTEYRLDLLTRMHNILGYE